MHLPIARFVRGEKDWGKLAHGEEYLKKKQVKTVVYGHTHLHKIVPLDAFRANATGIEQMYFNTGTWRKIHQKTVFGKTLDFMGWHVMTFIAFYQDDEHGERRFEVWNGALG
jgi:hypothetical protein